MADHYGIDPKYIEVEVTESVVVENVDELKGCFQNLKNSVSALRSMILEQDTPRLACCLRYRRMW